MKLGNEHQTAVKALTVAEPFLFKEKVVNKIKCTFTDGGEDGLQITRISLLLEVSQE